MIIIIIVLAVLMEIIMLIVIPIIPQLKEIMFPLTLKTATTIIPFSSNNNHYKL